MLPASASTPCLHVHTRTHAGPPLPFVPTALPWGQASEIGLGLAIAWPPQVARSLLQHEELEDAKLRGLGKPAHLQGSGPPKAFPGLCGSRHTLTLAVLSPGGAALPAALMPSALQGFGLSLTSLSA